MATPSFNANDFVVGIKMQQWRDLVENSGKPLQNKALQMNILLVQFLKY